MQHDSAMDVNAIAEKLRQGEEDIRAGRVRPIEEFLAELDRGEEMAN